MTAVSSLMALPSAVGFPNWRPIGVGGFGSVYAARRSDDGVEVAVKIAHRADDPRFVRELRALELVPTGTAPALLGHTRTPDGRPVLVLELLHGQTLAVWLARAPRPTLHFARTDAPRCRFVRAQACDQHAVRRKPVAQPGHVARRIISLPPAISTAPRGNQPRMDADERG